MTEDFISLDLETTGLLPKEDRIIEVAAIRFRKGKEVAAYHTYINPGREIPERITSLTGITSQQLDNAPSFQEVCEEILDFIGEDVLMAHHISFDYAFLKRAVVNSVSKAWMKEYGFEKMGIDTLKIARAFLPQLESRSLEALSLYYGISLDAHRAMQDATATAVLYNRLWEEFGDASNSDASKNKIFQPYPLIYKIKKEGPATKAQKERLYKALEKHTIIPEYDVEQLTKNEASRYLDRILSEYGR